MRFVRKIDSPVPDTLASTDTQTQRDKLFRADSTVRKKLLKESAPYWKGKYEINGAKKYAVIEALERLYHGKCAYCEKFCEMEIEHYRPKGGVKEDETHSGYFWLAFEWTNLLPACHDCNEMIKGKSHQFPIQNIAKRASFPLVNGVVDYAQFNISHSILTDEAPFLLNPEVDNPDDLFVFEWDEEGIAMKSRDVNLPNRASRTIEICNLNRLSLKRARGNVVKAEVIEEIDNSLALISDILGDSNSDNELMILAIEKVFSCFESKATDNTIQFTLLRKFVFENCINFENLVLINHKQKELLLEAFNFFKNK